MTKRAGDERIADFNEVNEGISEQNAVLEALRCMDCVRPQCTKGCPVNIDISAFIRAIAEEDFKGAAAIIKKDNMLPAICGRVCPQENQCEGLCVLGKKEKPVRIGALERFVADREREAGMTLPEIMSPTGKRVAVVGSGPAGITAAAELARYGHSVTVFESLHEAGGVLTYGIPEFRLPKEIVKAEIEQILDMGVELKLNHIAGRTVSVEELLEFDAVFLGTGAGLPSFMGIEGENLSGVYSANEFLTRVNLMHANAFPEYDTPVMKGSRVAVVGGGNVAMDSARVSRRMGAEVYLIYRRREEDLPAREEEVHNAIEEGVEFICCANPVKILGGPAVTGIECVRMEMCDLDESGRPCPVPMKGDEAVFTLDVDVVIEAIGQSPNPLLVSLIEGLERGRRGNVIVDEHGLTSVDRIYAGGDIATGAATVIEAMGTARKAAVSINEMLMKK
ncbi:NADPH-dependent glutamate synthase [Methanoplanus limicola]|uniref:Sulfide dehydrogenase (Flavoprotein) subunit SudA n=1 Tax=Methanoplanus limicola DSM 2279 TaxID=937775 RepID=H1Z498_9EURY|nr:NADPH-dependent glutamate synthase [Methanoplanus limicola]EHQ36646.1 sulfide dehydrogenase (flavoprotein) subunit SudA [Methanoplanus limicola DSM 2279]